MELLPEGKRLVADFSPEQVQQFVQSWFRASGQSSEEIAEKIANPQWQQVIEQVVKSQQPADRLLCLIKQSIDRSISGEPRLNQFLTWVLQKAESTQANYKPAALRAFYFALALDLALDRDLARNLALAINFDLALAYTLDFALALDFDLAVNFDLVLSSALDLARARAHACAHAPARDLALLASALFHALSYARTYARDLDPNFAVKLEQLKTELPSSENWQHFQQWWQTQGQQWLEHLRQAMIEHRNFGHDWQFNPQQKQRLKRYYGANYFLVELMKIEGAVSEEVRAEIEDSLLLPWSELQRRYPGTYGQADS